MTLLGIESLAALVWDASWHAAVVVLVALVARQLMGRRTPPVWRCGLWLLVGARLLPIAAPQGSWSVFGLLNRWSASEVATPESPIKASAPATPTGVNISIGYGGRDLNEPPHAATELPAVVRPRPIRF